MLLNSSVIGLQTILDKCSEVAKVLSQKFNAENRTVLSLGKREPSCNNSNKTMLTYGETG